MALIKDIAARALERGEPVWFGCDVGKMMSNEYGVWDANLYDLPSVYDTAFTFDKADRLIYHETQMTHAMLFTGVDVLDGVTRRWRVENSWGADKGKDGFYTMNDSWFDEYVFEIAARRDALPERAAPGARRRADRAAGLGSDGRARPLTRRSWMVRRPRRPSRGTTTAITTGSSWRRSLTGVTARSTWAAAPAGSPASSGASSRA